MGGKWTVIALGALAAVVAYYLMCGHTFNPDSIKGKRVLVTGSSSGLGEQIAYQYAKLGARIIIIARRAELLQKVAMKCKELGAEQVEIVKVDMNNFQDRIKVIDAVETMGGLDILVLNHGAAGFGLWHGQANMTVFRQLQNINFISHVDIASKLLPYLSESKGQIGVISSTAGKMPSAVLTILCSSKYALQGFFGALRQDLKIRNVDVSVTLAVLGLIDTDNARNHISKISSEHQHVVNIANYLSASPEETALEVIKAISARVPELYYPRHASFFVLLQNLFPEFNEDRSRSLFEALHGSE